jgi:hypothetical protein
VTGAGYIDRSGEVVIPRVYAWVSPLVGDKAVVLLQKGDEDKGRYFLIDRSGHRRLEVHADDAFLVSPDRLVLIRDEKRVLVDVKRPEEPLGCYERIAGFSEGLLAVETDKGWGFVDEDGQHAIVPEPAWELVTPFSDGLAAVRVDGKWGFIDPAGRMVIEPQYDRPGRFSHGLANVTKGERVYFIGKRGERAFAGDYCHAEPFSEGLAVVDEDGDGFAGYIDTLGRKVMAEEFAGLGGFSEGLARFHRSRREGLEGGGFIDKRGKVQIRIKERFVSIGDFVDGLAPVYLADGMGWIDKSGRWIWRSCRKDAEGAEDADGQRQASVAGGG